MYSLAYHNSCLSNICRICGQRAQTFAQIRKKNPQLCVKTIRMKFTSFMELMLQTKMKICSQRKCAQSVTL